MTAGVLRRLPVSEARVRSLIEILRQAGRGRAVSVPERVTLGAVLFAAFVIRLLWAAIMPVPPEADFLTFHQMAGLIAKGEWWSTSYGWQFQGPMYPLVLSPFAALEDGGLAAMRVLNAALQTGMVAFTWLLGRRLFGSPVGLVAACIAALLPGLWMYTPILASEHLAVLLLTGAMAFLAGRPFCRRPLVAGLFIGALIFTRPAFLFFPLVLLAYLAWQNRRERPWRRVRSLALGLVLVAAPVGLLNHSAGGPALPVGNAGWQQWLIFNERATGQWFPAIDRDDYPFEGLGSGELTDERVRAAQLKLAIQYALANPGELPSSFLSRFQITWGTDRDGLDWTVSRAPPGWGERLGVAGWLPGAIDAAYASVVALALLGAVAFRRRVRRLLPILLPILYIVAVHLPAEGNARYHLLALPFLAVLAAAAVTRPRRTTLLSIPVVAVLLTQRWALGVALMVAVLILVPFASPALRAGRRLISWRPTPTRQLTSVAFGLLVAMLLGIGGYVSARGALEELDAVDPRGWQAYRLAGGSREAQALRIAPSNVVANLRRVSFPDAVQLPAPGADTTVGVTRTLVGLEQEDQYTLYLQVWDPGSAGERLMISLNGRELWERPEGQAEGGGWRYVSVRWLADAPMATITVERRGSGDAVSGADPVLLRSLHLYPKY